MRICSDKLTEIDLFAEVPARCRLELRPMIRPKLRSKGWNAILTCPGNKRHQNTGTRGAGEEGAASWDQWGWFIAALYWLDEDLIAGGYKGFDHFHMVTKDRYRGF